MSSSTNICFYGAGNMAEAIVRGLIHKQVASPQQIVMLNRSNEERLAYLSQQYGITGGNSDGFRNKQIADASIIVLAIKPKDTAEVLRLLGSKIKDNTLIVSVVAGLSIETIQELLGFKAPVARTMPNTSSSIGLGATGITFSPEVSEGQSRHVLTMFEAIGTVSVIPEQQMEILTGVSGSGPAYIYYMMEAMIAAGIEGGLSPENARELTVQTVLGAAIMMKETGETPVKLRTDITSPNGSTQAALEVLAARGFEDAVKAAVHRSAERSREMGEAAKGTK